jgi:hypothetical protein
MIKAEGRRQRAEEIPHAKAPSREDNNNISTDYTDIRRLGLMPRRGDAKPRRKSLDRIYRINMIQGTGFRKHKRILNRDRQDISID